MINYYTIGQRVKEARKKKHLSQADLAEAVEKSTSYISYMETGLKCMSLETLVDIANALDVSADYILAGKSVGTQYPITLRVVGHDDIGIVTNITSIISKENGITLRSIGIDSNDGLFSGTLTVMVGDTGHLEALIKKLRTVKGVKQVSRN